MTYLHYIYMTLISEKYQKLGFPCMSVFMFQYMYIEHIGGVIINVH